MHCLYSRYGIDSKKRELKKRKKHHYPQTEQSKLKLHWKIKNGLILLSDQV